MCGGRGTRLDTAVEKPLYEVNGRTMVDRVCDALAESRVETIHPVVSPHTPRTRDHLDDRDGRVIDAPGEGYVADLGHALERVDVPVLTVAADLPLLAGDAIDAVLSRDVEGSLAMCVPAALKRVMGVSIGTTDEAGRAPTGVNVVADGGTETTVTTYDVRFAVNVNRLADARVAEELL